MNLIQTRLLSYFKKANRFPTKDEIVLIKDTFQNSEWRLQDEELSTTPAKQIYVTLQSLLDQSNPPYMEAFNSSTKVGKIINVSGIFKKGDEIPPGYSLAYCNPLSNESEIGTDGYDNYHAPTLNGLEFFARRMWVAGSYQFNLHNPLRFAEHLSFRETVDRIKFMEKSSMIITDYTRLFSNEIGISIKESRRFCYLGQSFVEKQESVRIKPTPDLTQIVTPSAISNLRMSAITFNAHKIHYDPEYTRQSENYPTTVIEAPLLISLALQFCGNQDINKKIKSFKYKISSPSYIDKPLTINYKVHMNSAELWFTNEHQITCFESIVNYDDVPQ